MNLPTKPTSNATTITLPATIERTATPAVPAVIAADGPQAAERFFTFFTDNIRNKNTRAAYYRNACRFFALVRGPRARPAGRPELPRLGLRRGAGPEPRGPVGEAASRDHPDAL